MHRQQQLLQIQISSDNLCKFNVYLRLFCIATSNFSMEARKKRAKSN